MREVNAILTIAFRDFAKLLRDNGRIAISFIFPVIFIGALGGSLQANFGSVLNYNFQTFVFIGVFAQTFFQSTASGIISLIQDRENDFSQEMFVSPISRYSIIFGKILGETMVSLVQVIGILVFGVLLQVPLSITDILILLPAGVISSLLGGAFGTIVMANLSNQRAASQIFPLLLFPQFFLAGVFNPIQELPLPLWILSRIAPMTYAVDFVRHIYYFNKPEYQYVIINPFWVDVTVISVMFITFLAIGTFIFVRNERNR
jgi:ABC-2 type transport system permease protein